MVPLFLLCLNGPLFPSLSIWSTLFPTICLVHLMCKLTVLKQSIRDFPLCFISSTFSLSRPEEHVSVHCLPRWTSSFGINPFSARYLKPTSYDDSKYNPQRILTHRFDLTRRRHRSKSDCSLILIHAVCKRP